MKFEQIKKTWRKDSEIDVTKLDLELIKISKLHCKYYEFLVQERRQEKLSEIEYNKMKKIKREYYLGRLPRKFLLAQDWEPIEYEIRPSDIGDYLKGDKDLCKLEGKLRMHEIKIEYLKGIIKSIHERGFHLRDTIEWIKFKNNEH